MHFSPSFLCLLPRSFDGETGLTKALETAINYNQMMRELNQPVSRLLVAGDLDAIRGSIIDVFGFLKKVCEGRERKPAFFFIS